MDTGRFLVYIKAEQIYVDILKYVEGRFGTSNYEIERKNQNVIGLIKDELCEKIIREFTRLMPKTYG